MGLSSPTDSIATTCSPLSCLSEGDVSYYVISTPAPEQERLFATCWSAAIGDNGVKKKSAKKLTIQKDDRTLEECDWST